MELRYEGPGHVLVMSGHEPLKRGETDEFSEAEAEELLTNPHIDVTDIASEVSSETAPLERPAANGSRQQWVEYAGALGLTIDDGVTRDQIIAVIDGEHTEQEG